MKRISFLLILSLLMLLYGCSNSEGYCLEGLWEEIYDPTNTIEFKFTDDTLIQGKSCFVFQNGRRIDCAEDENISLVPNGNNFFEGEFASDYKYKTLKIKVTLVSEKKMILEFVDIYNFRSQMIFRKTVKEK